MVVITAAQRANPAIADWVAAKDAQNAAEALLGANATAAQKAAAAAAVETKQIDAWKATIPSPVAVVTNAVQKVVETAKTVVQAVTGGSGGISTPTAAQGGGSGVVTRFENGVMYTDSVITQPVAAKGSVETVTKIIQGPFIQPDGSVTAGKAIQVPVSQPTQQTTAGANSVTPVMTGAVDQVNAAIIGGIESRRAELQSFTGWDNDANIRSIQQKSWDIYINTGSWSSSEQKQLHDKAEAARKAINLAYQGALWGTADKAAADALILPTDQFPTSNKLENGLSSLLNGGQNGTIGNGIGLLLSGGLLLLIFSAFKRH